MSAAEVFRATQAQKARERGADANPTSQAGKIIVISESPQQPMFEEDRTLQVNDEPSSQVEVVPPINQNRKDFVSRQNELWGASDDLAPGDIPEGELTYEQYLAMRPEPQEGDRYHENGRVHDALTGAFVKVGDYEEGLNRRTTRQQTTNYYEDFQQNTQTRNDHEAAIAQNERYDAAMDEIIRDNTEGEILVNKDTKLRGLMTLGEEMRDIYDSNASSEHFGKKRKLAFESKKAIFEDLLELYRSQGSDERALGYIADKTYAPVEEAEFIAVEGHAVHNSEKVKVVDFNESPDGKQKSYVIEKVDGSREVVHGTEVEFRREYATPEQESPKKWWQKASETILKRAGTLYWAAQWKFESLKQGVGNRINEINHNVQDSMTDEEKEQKRNRNRVARIAAGAGIATVAGLGLYLSVKGFIDSPHSNGFNFRDGVDAAIGAGGNTETSGRIPTGEEARLYDAWLGGNIPEPSTAPQPDQFNLPLSGSDQTLTSTEIPAVPSFSGIEVNPGEGGQALFERLNIDPAKWYQNVDTLADRFKEDFEWKGSDLRIRHSGQLSVPAQEFINSLR
ncbi:MAG: hypothetical protein WAR37_05090 [Candidatus Microsaccharimonas sp.]